jgi:uncharacterized membrane protein YphA (DoxX/SURF4 family)
MIEVTAPAATFTLKYPQMKTLNQLFNTVDIRLTNWMARYGVLSLRISLGIVFFWFGVLKYFPGLSPAANLATRTIQRLSFGAIQPETSIYILATWECLIGLGLITGIFMRVTLLLLFTQMLGTITPLVLFPHEVFTRIPYAPTLEGQYIIKNLVLISAGLVIGATVRGGAVVADPEIARKAQEEAENLSDDEPSH